MDKKSSAPSSTLSVNGGRQSHKKDDDHTGKKATSLTGQGVNTRSVFVTMALTMTWQLAIAVLVPIFAGSQLDSYLGTGSTYTFIGLGVALIGSIAVMWRAMQAANKIPVPKLTEAQKRAIKKSYEEEDKDE